MVNNEPTFLIVMGVSGTGKSTLAAHLAEKLNFVMIEADDFHSDEARAMMRNNEPLTEAIRLPWIERLCQQAQQYLVAGKSVVMAYSGLKYHHRNEFRKLAVAPIFICLTGDKNIIADRMEKRTEHFVSAEFLTGQLAAFEPPKKSETDIYCINTEATRSQVLENSLALVSDQITHRLST